MEKFAGYSVTTVPDTKHITALTLEIHSAKRIDNILLQRKGVIVWVKIIPKSADTKSDAEVR